MIRDPQTLSVFGGILILLAVGTVIGLVLQSVVKAPKSVEVVRNLNARIRAWWAMCAVFALALATGGLGSVLLFALTSFLALREFVTLTPTRAADHRTLFWAFFVITPLQYLLVATRWYGLFSVLIPVYGFLFVPTRIVLEGDTTEFLGRAARIQWALLVCVYCVSHAPALLMLDIPGYAGQNAKLLLFLIVVVQASDVLQYVFGKTLGTTKIAPSVSPNKTVEGFVGGIASATLLAALLGSITPFGHVGAGAMGLVITLMGFAGGLVMSAIKRDRGVKDYGAMIEGHGGIMDRIDSICFAAPVFFHLTRYFYT